MKFSELPEEQKIAFVQSKFIFIVQDIVNAPANLEKYVPLPKEPTIVAPKLTPITDSMASQKKVEAEAANDKLVKIAEEENAKNQAEYKKQLADHAKIKAYLAGIKPREHCMCDIKCLDWDSCLKVVEPELEVLIDEAHKLAEAGNYQ